MQILLFLQHLIRNKANSQVLKGRFLQHLPFILVQLQFQLNIRILQSKIRHQKFFGHFSNSNLKYTQFAKQNNLKQKKQSTHQKKQKNQQSHLRDCKRIIKDKQSKKSTKNTIQIRNQF